MAGDLFSDLLVVGFGNAAGDAGQRVAVAAERDGQADGTLYCMSTYFALKPICNVANENPLVREIRLPGAGKQNLWVGISDFQQ